MEEIANIQRKVDEIQKNYIDQKIVVMKITLAAMIVGTIITSILIWNQ